MKRTEIKVRGYHCDAYGHVNNARYLEFLEEGRWNFLQPAQDQGIFEQLGLLFVVVNINISYKATVIPNDTILVEVKELKFNNMSMLMTQVISKGDVLCNTAEVSFVLLDKDSMKAVRIDDQIKAVFEDLMNN